MIRILAKTTRSATYYVNDQALELDGVRDGPAAYWVRGTGRIDEDVLQGSWPSPPRSKTLGYDLVIAAPRPLSILLAVGSPSEQRELVRLHRAAVREALGYLEDRALVVRASALGESLEQRARWSAIPAFTHGVNRAGEPHLHDHVLVSAVPAHRTRTLDRRALQNHALAADAIYRAELRFHVGQTGIRTAWRTFGGLELVSGIDEGFRALWPGERSYGSSKLAWTREMVTNQWRRDLERFVAIHEPTPPAASRVKVNEHTFASHFEGNASVSRSDLVVATANASVFGAPRRAIERFIDTHYPALARDRGSQEQRISPAAARQLERVRERGPRIITIEGELQRDRSRSVDRSR